MKKILFITLLASSLFAQAKIYMGFGYNLYSESYSYSASALPDTVDNALRLKAGYGIRDSYAVEFSLDYIDHAQYAQNKQTGKAKYGFNVSLLKAFDFGIFINPYIKAGFGTGIIDNFGEAEKSLTYGSFDLGTGFFIPMGEDYDIEVAYEYRNLSYQKQDQLNSTIQNRSHVNTAYLGINLRF